METHQGINASKISISGVGGAIYMVQFLVWAFASPAVGIFYTALIGAGLLCAPVIYYLNRSEQRSITSLRGGVLGFLSGVAFLAVFSERGLHLAEVIVVCALGGAGLAVLLLKKHSRDGHPSVKPYQ